MEQFRAWAKKHMTPVLMLAVQVVPKEQLSLYLVTHGLTVARSVGFNDDELRAMFERAIEDSSDPI